MNDFEKLNKLYNTICKLDELYTDNSIDHKLDKLNEIIAEYDNKLYLGNSDENNIILEFRKGILNIYSELFNQLNQNIETPGSMSRANIKETKPGKSKNVTIVS